jgi:ribonuclease P protein component
LDQPGVLAVLKKGKRLIRSGFELRFLNLPCTAAVCESRIAISVPKRLVKSSVARNRIKRLVREEFRLHRAATAPIHMLINYQARNDGRDSARRRILRRELASLFADAIVRAQIAPVDDVRARAG